MKISKHSWHYRFNSFVSDSSVKFRTHTTCSYIRTTIVNMLVATMMCIFACSGVLAVGSAVLSGIYYPIALVFGLPLATKIVELAIGFWIILLGAGVCFLFIVLLEKAKDRLAQRKLDRELSLLLQAAEDRKQGVCTIVEFV